jgi:transcriptional regulator
MPTGVAVGERASKAKLTPSQVREIRTRARAGETVREIARSYGVHHTNVSAIMRGKSWSHIADEEI